jgi:hypothetical protein
MSFENTIALQMTFTISLLKDSRKINKEAMAIPYVGNITMVFLIVDEVVVDEL